MTVAAKRPLHWESAQLHADARTFFNSQLEAIAAARKSVDFEYYIFNYDVLGQRFVEALIGAAERGVRVRVMMDGVGSMAHCELLSERLTAHGVQVRIYHPLPWLFDTYRWGRWSRRWPRGWLARFITLVWNINRRNHRKLCTVDGHRAWLGSFNITADHLPVSEGGQGWRDYGVELSGPRIESLAAGFDDLWEGHAPRLQRGFLAGFLSNRSVKARQLRNFYVARTVRNARRRVWLVNAYFLPTALLRRALLAACRSGCDVRLILPERSDVAVFPSLSSHYYRELLRAGARIFLYQPGVLHAKALLVDEQAVLGSSNWNYRSTLHDLELDVVLRDPDAVKPLEQTLLADMADSREVAFEDTLRPGLVSWLLYGLRYWM
ncbi:MAG: phospholipase D-like domain-containing protein [Halieaceae bacterium]|jgi:cardiolipin synthase|nr:phospholipase D-like domain-containing protein [Halieaceae bacterium]